MPRKGGSGASFRIVADTLTVKVMSAGHNLPENVQNALLSQAQLMLEYAQENAPWTDRTGEARAGLDVDVDHDNGNAYVSLFHTVDYGRWLEVIQSGRFAIIMPTLELFAGEIFDSVGA